MASILCMQQSILPDGMKDLADQSVVSAENVWITLSDTSVPTSEVRHPESLWRSTKGKSRVLDIALLHDEHMLKSALQSPKWQLIGMS